MTGLAHDLLAQTRELGGWMYVIVALFALFETAAFLGLVLPGETIVVIGGVAAHEGHVALAAIVAAAWAGALCGDAVGFFLGRRLGRLSLERAAARFRIGRSAVTRVESIAERHGEKVVFLGRFVGVVRALAPFVVGAVGFRYRRLLPWSVAGTFLWATAFTLVGYAFAASFDRAANLVAGAMFAVAAAITAAVVVRSRRAASSARF